MLLPPTVTVVSTNESLSNSFPSGTTLSGSTVAWLVISPGAFGANTLTVMSREVGTPLITLREPLKSPPVQLTTPDDCVQKKRAEDVGFVSFAEMNRVPSGRLSRTTTLLTGSVPALVTCRL